MAGRAIVPVIVALLDDQGRWIRPGVPVDECGKPRFEYREGLGRLRTEPAGPAVR